MTLSAVSSIQHSVAATCQFVSPPPCPTGSLQGLPGGGGKASQLQEMPQHAVDNLLADNLSSKKAKVKEVGPMVVKTEVDNKKKYSCSDCDYQHFLKV